MKLKLKEANNVSTTIPEYKGEPKQGDIIQTIHYDLPIRNLNQLDPAKHAVIKTVLKADSFSQLIEVLDHYSGMYKAWGNNPDVIDDGFFNESVLTEDEDIKFAGWELYSDDPHRYDDTIEAAKKKRQFEEFCEENHEEIDSAYNEIMASRENISTEEFIAKDEPVDTKEWESIAKDMFEDNNYVTESYQDTVKYRMNNDDDLIIIRKNGEVIDKGIVDYLKDNWNDFEDFRFDETRKLYVCKTPEGDEYTVEKVLTESESNKSDNKEYIKTVKAPNGSFWNIYKKDGKYVDEYGTALTPQEIKDFKLEELKEFDVFNASPEEIDDYYSDLAYEEALKADTPEEVFANVCQSAASEWMSSVDEETREDFIRAMISDTAERNYRQLVDRKDRDKYSDDDFFNEVVLNLQNGRGIKFNFDEQIEECDATQPTDIATTIDYPKFKKGKKVQKGV